MLFFDNISICHGMFRYTGIRALVIDIRVDSQAIKKDMDICIRISSFLTHK